LDNSEQVFLAKTVSGLEPVLASELEAIGAQNIQLLTRAVQFTGDTVLMYKTNYVLRTALRVLKKISTFKVANEAALYDRMYDFPWENYFTENQTFAIDSVVGGKLFTHSLFVSQKAKDGLVDRFRNRTGVRPSVDTQHPDLRINIHIYEDDCTLSLDSSGESLHKRGYRIAVDKAPLNEVLAAGLIQLSGWKADCHFVDGMCGSGTLPIEAAMYAMKIPAGYFREDYGFMHWNDFDPAVWKKITKEYSELIGDFDFEIIGSDRSAKAISIARENIQKAHLQKDIQLLNRNFENLQLPEGNGILMLNPPYGERLEETDIVGLYKMIGDVLKQNYKGWQAWVISSDIPVLKLIGLKPSKKITVFNGPLECRFVRFDIFGGSYKDMKAAKTD
jgi:putative N6-adenine-specific DNA methylase